MDLKESRSGRGACKYMLEQANKESVRARNSKRRPSRELHHISLTLILFSCEFLHCLPMLCFGSNKLEKTKNLRNLAYYNVAFA